MRSTRFRPATTRCRSRAEQPSPDGTVRISATEEAPTRLLVDLAATGAIRVRLARNPEEYFGPAVIVLAEVDERLAPIEAWTELDFPQGPYELIGLSPGRYSVGVRLPRSKPDDEGASHSVQVFAGEITEIAWTLD